jgi:hypothetical protein
MSKPASPFNWQSTPSALSKSLELSAVKSRRQAHYIARTNHQFTTYSKAKVKS